MGGHNEMKIGAPKAKRVYADFSFNAQANTTISFYRGATSGFNCSLNMKRSFVVMTLDERGSVVESKSYAGFPENLTFSEGKNYLIRHLVQTFLEYCDYLNVGLLAASK